MSIIWKILFLIYLAGEIFANDLQVNTPLGTLQGYYKTSSKGRTYGAFEGIPYAKPPVGNLRFEPPQPFGSWPGTLYTTKIQSKCVQFIPSAPNPQDRVQGSEDCLYLNVYVPSVNTSARASRPLPVLFWIHGGGFKRLEGPVDNEMHAMNRKMIVVNVNSRLDIFGYMSTDDEVVPGNMGLKDQSMALRWVYNNIEHFGGDPHRITIAGISSGAMCTHLHYMSPLSRGLFRGGISFSGSALASRAVTENNLEKVGIVASLQGCPTNDTREIVKCLKSRSARSIITSVAGYQPWWFLSLPQFGPVVEKRSPSPFMDRLPIEIINSGDVTDVPWLMTLVSDEGLYPGAEFIAEKDLLDELSDHPDKMLPTILDFEYTIPQWQHAEVSLTIKDHYFGSTPINEAPIKNVMRMIGDRLVSAAAGLSARLMAKANASPVWSYFYSYDGSPVSLTQFYRVPKGYGVCHNDDVFVILPNKKLGTITDPPTLRMRKVLLDIVESFVQTGVPRTKIDWPRVDGSGLDLKYLHIAGPEDLTISSNSNVGDIKFWSSIPFNENQLTIIQNLEGNF